MEFTRNHYLIIGFLLFVMGLQFRYVTSFVLNEKASQFVDRRLGNGTAAPKRSFFSFGSPRASTNHRVVSPPRWLGWSLMSVGGVLFCFSLTMRKPGG